MGFLAAWGIGLGVKPSQIGLGLALVYAVSSLGMLLSRYQDWRLGVAILSAGVLAGGSALFFAPAQWYGLCASIGVLVFFRDRQTAEMLAWLPVRARRRGMTNHDAIRMTTVLSALVLAVGLTLAGFVSRHWAWLPHAMVLLALIKLVPQQIRSMGPPKKYISLHQNPELQSTQNWLLRLAMIFNSANFLGRRLLLPAALLMIASNMGHGDKALPVLGATLGFMGLVGALARPPKRFSRKMGPYDFLRWGARLTLLGWVILASGVLLWTVYAAPWAVPVIVFGWAMLELTNKTWGVAYMECLRQSSSSAQKSLATRAHRLALSRFMVYKSAGGALGLGLASLMPVSWVPPLVIVLAVVAFMVLEND